MSSTTRVEVFLKREDIEVATRAGALQGSLRLRNHFRAPSLLRVELSNKLNKDLLKILCKKCAREKDCTAAAAEIQI